MLVGSPGIARMTALRFAVFVEVQIIAREPLPREEIGSV
jgi:hypothetical protein